MAELLQCFAVVQSLWPLIALGTLAFGFLIGAAVAKV